MYDKELDIINHIRGKVLSRKSDKGANLFLVWGYPAAVFLLLEFGALMLWGQNWCQWLWVGIPLVGAPLMIHYLRKDYDRTGHRTHEEDLALQLWLFVGFACCLGGFATGFSGLFERCFCTFQCLLVSMGCFLTGVISRFRPMTLCGIVGAILSFSCLFFQDDLWPWQLFMAAVITVITLIIPGHLSLRQIKKRNLQYDCI